MDYTKCCLCLKITNIYKLFIPRYIMKIQLNLDEETNKRLKFEKLIRNKNTLAETAEEIIKEMLNYNKEDVGDEEK